MAKEMLSEKERAAVRAAVEAAESQSGVEIVPVVTPTSDSYRVADQRGALIGGIVGVLLQASLTAPVAWGDRWSPAVWTAVGALVGLGLARLPTLRVVLAGAGEISACVAAGARDSFLAQEVFRTRDRTGMLIYVSLLERRVEVLADAGVYQAVPQEDWQRVADEVAREMSRREPATALLEAIRRAGELVAVHGPYRRDDDVNELPDQAIETRS